MATREEVYKELAEMAAQYRDRESYEKPVVVNPAAVALVVDLLLDIRDLLQVIQGKGE
jgi:hypothetical protein